MAVVIYNEECLAGMASQIEDTSVDMILSDLPFGTTMNKWDSVIPLNHCGKNTSESSRQPAQIEGRLGAALAYLRLLAENFLRGRHGSHRSKRDQRANKAYSPADSVTRPDGRVTVFSGCALGLNPGVVGVRAPAANNISASLKNRPRVSKIYKRDRARLPLLGRVVQLFDPHADHKRYEIDQKGSVIVNEECAHNRSRKQSEGRDKGNWRL